jgi:membrane protease YdiL (CAAX protease family)
MLDDDTAFLLLVPPLLAAISGAGAAALVHFLTSSPLAGVAMFAAGVVVGWRTGRKILERA